MQSWILWAGISFIVGGIISWGLTVGALGTISLKEDLSGYSIGWILVGIILAIIGYIKRKH